MRFFALAAALLSAVPASALLLNGPLPALNRIGAARTSSPQRSVQRRSPGSTMTITLPACSAAGFVWVAAGGACTAVGLQLGLQSIFQRSSDPVLSKVAGVNAHSVIAALFCIFVTGFGSLGWFNPPAALVATAATRVLTPIDSVRWLAAFGFGVIGFWVTRAATPPSPPPCLPASLLHHLPASLLARPHSGLTAIQHASNAHLSRHAGYPDVPGRARAAQALLPHPSLCHGCRRLQRAGAAAGSQ